MDRIYFFGMQAIFFDVLMKRDVPGLDLLAVVVIGVSVLVGSGIVQKNSMVLVVCISMESVLMLDVVVNLIEIPCVSIMI